MTAENKQTQEYSAQDVIVLAELFFETAIHCSNLVETKLLKGTTLSYQSLLSPFIANIALSIELYLKAAYSVNNIKIPRMHDLHNLYLDLPERARTLIEKEYDDAHAQNPNSQGAENQGVDCSLKGVLTEIKQAFVRARYSYENSESQPCYSAENVVIALQQYLKNIDTIG